MAWIELNTLVKLPDRHPDDPDEWYAVFKVTPDGAEIVGYTNDNPCAVPTKEDGE